MTQDNEKRTSFRTSIDIYCYKVMSFSLKNVGATYQRTMTCIYDDLIYKYVKYYVDYLVVKKQGPI